MDFVAIDFETANHRRSSACSVAVVEVCGGRLRDAYYALIRPPELDFHPMNIQIHGITPADVRDKPTFDRIWPELKPWLDGKIVLAHNASFDMGVLKGCMMEYGLEPPRFRHCCTVSIARKAWPQLENHKLGTLGAYFHIDFRHHNALDDARTCAAIAIRAAQEADASDFTALVERFHLTVKDFS